MSIYNFSDRHIGPRKSDVLKMLKYIGANSLEELINKTLYHKYSYEALKDSMTIPYIPRETND